MMGLTFERDALFSPSSPTTAINLLRPHFILQGRAKMCGNLGQRDFRAALMSCANAHWGRGGCRSRLFRGSVIVFLAGESERGGAALIHSFRHTCLARVQLHTLLLQSHIILGHVYCYSSAPTCELPGPFQVSMTFPTLPHRSHK